MDQHLCVISKGAQGGGAPFVRIVFHFGELNPQASSIDLPFQSKLIVIPIFCLQSLR